MARWDPADRIVAAPPPGHTRGAADQEGLEMTVTKGLLVRLHARPGREQDVASFLDGVMPLIRQEPATTALFAFRLSEAEFGIFNAFPDQAGRDAHIHGDAAGALFARAEELLVSAPEVEPLDVVAAKLPPDDES
jgi:quinol monooxygenase YgiN